MNLKEFLNRVYILKDLQRWNQTWKIKKESVIEHIGFVSLITLELHEYYDFNLREALTMALTHDLGEIEIGDIQASVKQKNPELKKAIKKAEKKAFSTWFPQYYPQFYAFEEGETLEARIVKLADVMSCIQFSERELKLGNTGYMEQVFKSSNELTETIMKSLEGALR